MVDVAEFIDNVLSHGRYDPVKAHEYYERTKELKGRRSASDLKSEKKKAGWAYTKDQVEQEKKSALSTASEGNKQALIQLRGKAAERREEIRQKLQKIMEQIGKESKEGREDLDQKTKAAIEALPKMPNGLNKQQQAEFAEKRREEIAKIRGEASNKKVDITNFTKAWREGERTEASKTREEIAGELKGSLEKARENYKAARDQVKAKYEAELDAEFESIRTLRKGG